ncbi:MAG: mandelate racemase/muconate lactonizing enzyme family protein [Chloroflexi bacterium]|nr:mandelate racemase/muconate lactonizing enzyme family protein [Chloroflexota bacterium]
MKVTGFTTKVVSVPRETGPLGDGPGAMASNFVTLKLHTDEGVDGISYAGFTSFVMLKALKAAVDSLCELVIGEDPINVEAINHRLTAWAGGGSPAGLVTRTVSAIDVAMWDLKGKALGEPVYRLLGGFRDRVPTYFSGKLWRPYNLEELAESSADLVAQGFKAMKFRMGAEDTAAKEIARMQVMRESVGPDIDIMLDINQGWDVNTAIAIGRELAAYDLFWLEDPTNHQDYEGLARIADALDTPIAAGEYHYGIMPFRYMLEHRSIDIVMVDLLRAGGITQWMKVAHMAEAYNLPVVSHLAPEFLSHGIAAIPNGMTVELMPWAYPLFKEEPKVEDGMMVLPDAPGFGMEFDDEALERYAVN